MYANSCALLLNMYTFSIYFTNICYPFSKVLTCERFRIVRSLTSIFYKTNNLKNKKKLLYIQQFYQIYFFADL